MSEASLQIHVMGLVQAKNRKKSALETETLHSYIETASHCF